LTLNIAIDKAFFLCYPFIEILYEEFL